MGHSFLVFNRVFFGYTTAAEPLFQNISFHAPPGWTGVVGANGAGKTTLLRLASGELRPDDGSIVGLRHAVYCPQRTDLPPGRLPGLLAAADGEAVRLRDRLQLGSDWAERWDRISFGERKRAQIAAALWTRPDILALDEPTNHLDRAARDILIAGLKAFRGVGLLVSHDRELLDRLCGRCLFLEPPRILIRPGGVTAGMDAAELERRSLERRRRVRKAGLKKQEAEWIRRRTQAGRADKRRSKGGLSPRDHDAREKKDRARLTGKDAVGGKLQAQMEARLGRTRAELDDLSITKRYTAGIWLPGSVSRRDFLFQCPPGEIPLGEVRRLTHPELLIRVRDRIALTGPNGSGKTSLLRTLIPDLNCPEGRVVHVPQELGAGAARALLDEVRGLPGDRLGHLMQIISRLGSNPGRLLGSACPSPGETRKLMLALGMTREPHIVIMDEPTNHMDLISARCLEDALEGCPGGLILVSHDRRFLERLTLREWRIAPDAEKPDVFRLEKAGSCRS